MAEDNKSQWRDDKIGIDASAEADDGTPKFSGDDIEFESFMFDGGGPSGGAAVAQLQAAPAATASATKDAVPSTMGDLLSTSGPLYEEQPAPAMAQDASVADLSSPAMPAFSLDASEPVDNAPADPADTIVPPAFQPEAAEIAGGDTPMPFHLQTSEPEIPPFVPDVPIQPQLSCLSTTGGASGPLSQSAPSMSNGSGPLYTSDALAADGWTDSSLSVVEDFSSVLLAMQAGSHFPLMTGGAAVLDAPHSTDTLATAPPQQEDFAQSSAVDYPMVRPAEQESSQQTTAQQDSQAPTEPAQAVEMLDDGPAMYGQSDVAIDATPQPAEMSQEALQTAAPLMEQASVAPQETAEVEDGQFKGDALEFESFMFTSPGASAQHAMPSPVAQMAPEQSEQTPPEMLSQTPGVGPASENTGTLPFWLQTGELPALPDAVRPDAVTPDEGDAKATTPSEAAMAEMKIEAEDLEMVSAPTLESVQQDDYADLPPIDPFDFSLLAPVEEEESLGFNLQELEGMISADRVSTKVTTDLSALAEFLGTKPQADMLKYQTEEAISPDQPDRSSEEPVQEAQIAASEYEQTEATPSPANGKGTTVLGKGTTGLRPQAEDDTRSPSWTSTVTSDLSAETRAQVEQLAAAQAEVEANPHVEAIPPAGDIEDESPPVAAMDASNDVPDIDPFNYTELDLDDEETATEQLASMAALTSVLDTGGQPTTPVSGSQLRPGGDLASGIPLDTGSFDVDNETSFFSSGQPTKEVGAKSTGWLSDTEGQGPTAEYGMKPAAKAKGKSGGADGGSRARVARADSKEHKNLDTNVVGSPSSTGTGVSQEETGADALQTSTPATAGMPANYVSSGPLPAVEGFGTLQEMAERNPDDLSTQMALASAYAQSGEYDSALRVYRRALKKRNLSLAMLEVIADEISDLEADAADLPRFHQVLGDLYMKQGRYKDAIDEYNKIG